MSSKTLFAKFIILKTIGYFHVYVTKFVYNDIVHITSKKYGVSHTKGHGSWHMCEANFVVSSIIMYNTFWCLLWHILH